MSVRKRGSLHQTPTPLFFFFFLEGWVGGSSSTCSDRVKERGIRGRDREGHIGRVALPHNLLMPLPKPWQ